jgi:hypothetical protein
VGIVNLKVAPRPVSDSTQMRPPWRSTTFLQSANPMPVPGISLPCRRLNMPNTSLASAGSIPMPLSLTENSHPSAVLSAETWTVGAVSPLYLMTVAKPAKLGGMKGSLDELL